MSFLHQVRGPWSVVRSQVRRFGQALIRASDAMGPSSGLQRIILPSARDRWQSTTISTYTPDRIEGVIRSALSGDLVAVYDLYDLMEATWPRLQKNLNELKDDVASATWLVQPWTVKGQKPTPEAQRRAGLMDQALWAMRPRPESDENDFRATIKDVLDAWGKGIAVLEVDWEIKSQTAAQRGKGEKEKGGQSPSAPLPLFSSAIFAPRATRWIHPRYYGYPFDQADLALNMIEVSRASGISNQWSAFPPDKFLIGIAKQKSGHPVGGALLRALAWWWCASNFAAEWFLNFAQIFGLPIRWATYDPNRPGLLTQIADMLENMGSAGWGAFPAGTTIELKEATKGAEQIPQAAMLDRADRQCDLLVLGQTLTTEVGDTGSYAAAKVHKGVLTGRKKAAGDWAASVLSQQLSPMFCRLNFGDDRECPWLAVTSEAEEEPLVMAQRDEIMLRNQVPLPTEWFYDRHKIPVPISGESVIIGKPQMAPGLPGQDDGTGENGENGDRVLGGTPRTATETVALPYHAKDATEQLIDNVLENLTGVQAKWLGGVKPFFRVLVQQAQNDRISDEDFLRALQAAQKQLPELFELLDTQALEGAFYQAMSAAAINGAVKGAMKRRTETRKQKTEISR